MLAGGDGVAAEAEAALGGAGAAAAQGVATSAWKKRRWWPLRRWAAERIRLSYAGSDGPSWVSLGEVERHPIE